MVNGDQSFLDLNDGTTIPVDVMVDEITTSAIMRGDDFAPVSLNYQAGLLNSDDIGKAGRLRLSKPLLKTLRKSWERWQ